VLSALVDLSIDVMVLDATPKALFKPASDEVFWLSLPLQALKNAMQHVILIRVIFSFFMD
jgi:hypothetical protein